MDQRSVIFGEIGIFDERGQFGQNSHEMSKWVISNRFFKSSIKGGAPSWVPEGISSPSERIRERVSLRHVFQSETFGTKP